MNTARTLAGLLLLAIMMGTPPTAVWADEEKRGFKPGRFIGKLIPGGKDREEDGSATTVPGSGDAAVVVPLPDNPVVPPIPNPSSIMAPGERIPPPPIPGAAPMATTTTAAPSPFVTPEPAEKERGILGGVRGMVGKVIPGGRDEERATVAPPMEDNDDRGLIGRLRDRRDGGSETGVIPPPMIIPRPAPEPVPAADGPVASAPRTLTIPTARSGNPNAPLQREERPVDTVEQERTASIKPSMPTAGPAAPAPLAATTQAEVGRMALGEPPVSESPQVVSEPITPSVPVSQLTSVPETARPAVEQMPVVVAPPVSAGNPASPGLVISDGGGGVAAPVSVSAPQPSAVSALTGQPVAPQTPVVARVDTQPEDPATGGTHFVTVRDGVAGSLRLADGRALPAEAGMVLKFLSLGEGRVRVRLPDGAEADIEAWQVRDATFDEAVEFVKQSG